MRDGLGGGEWPRGSCLEYHKELAAEQAMFLDKADGASLIPASEVARFEIGSADLWAGKGSESSAGR